MSKYTHVRYYQECPICGNKAWEYKIKPEAVKPYGEIKILAKDIIHADKPRPYSTIRCQYCKTQLPLIYQGHPIFKKYLLVEKT